jgi:predicted AAA+ superfamily ATPase
MYKRMLKISSSTKKSFFLFGPRGTGKTSWVKSTFPNAVYFDCLDAKVYTELLSDPKRINNYIPKNFDNWIIIDEVQKIPEILNEVHRLIENKHYRFILTGSSARKLRRKGVNLLAGRALIRSMHPFTAIELGNDFDLQRALRFGQLPAIVSEPDPQDFLKTYTSIYLKEEILQEGLTRDLGAFVRFLEMASFSQGSLLNMSEIAREANIRQKTIVDYFEILNDLLLAYKVPIFTKRAKRRLVSHPKFYYFDVGVYLSIRPKGILDTFSELNGIAMETLFFQELMAINDYLQLDYKLYYWRTSYGTEVDFIAYGEKNLLAFEVKSKIRINSKDLKGLNAFKKDYPMAKCYMIHLGNQREYHKDIMVIPIQEALFMLPKLLT